MKPEMTNKSGLTEKEIEVLRKHWRSLKRDIRMRDIIDTLIQDGVLKPSDWEDIKKKHVPEKEKTEEFLFLMIVS